MKIDRRSLAAGLLVASRPRLVFGEGGGIDTDATYRRAYAEAAATRGMSGTLPPRLPAPVAARLRGGRVIFVGGLLRRLAEALARMVGQPIGIGGYFDAQRAALEAQGIATVELDVASEGPIAANAAEIARAIAASPGPVTLVTHSKGSLDALAALIGDPSLAAPPRGVAAWISLQAPFYGSPLADLNARDPLVRELTGYLLRQGFGGSPEALLELRVSEREPYQRANAPAIGELVRVVPTVCYGSYLIDEMRSLFRITWLICKFEGQPLNDGLVGVPSAHLPDALQVTEAGVDHAMAVIKVPGTGSFDPATCLTALLSLALG